MVLHCMFCIVYIYIYMGKYQKYRLVVFYWIEVVFPITIACAIQENNVTYYNFALLNSPIGLLFRELELFVVASRPFVVGFVRSVVLRCNQFHVYNNKKNVFNDKYKQNIQESALRIYRKGPIFPPFIPVSTQVMNEVVLVSF